MLKYVDSSSINVYTSVAASTTRFNICKYLFDERDCIYAQAQIAGIADLSISNSNTVSISQRLTINIQIKISILPNSNRKDIL